MSSYVGDFAAQLTPQVQKVRLAPRQTMPIALRATAPASRLAGQLHYRRCSDDPHRFTARELSFELDRVDPGEPIRYTFLDGDGSVQFAVATPPTSDCASGTPDPPIVVALHGAGVDVRIPWLAASVRRQRAGVWTVFPTGRSPWGHDWHGSSLRNVFAAVEALGDLHRRIFPHSACRPDAQKLIVLGHSNGGAGAWYLGSRFPDRVVGMVPVAA